MADFPNSADSAAAPPAIKPLVPTVEEQRAFLDGQGESRYATLDPGQTVRGFVTSVLLEQDTDFVTGQGKFIEAEVPQMMMRALLRDGTGPQAQRWIVEIRKGQRRDAIRQAVQDAGVTGIEVGGWLELSCVSKQNNRKIYAARYTPPPQPQAAPAPSMAEAQAAVPGAFSVPGDPSVHPANQGFPVAADGVQQQTDQPPF
ncbi:hypothetical protein [Streptomyces sp. NPDC051684]|uniref:hypothetical protein n=1 Tax=Streptomyces sp. NPDC051684 TaxID=3365670 RepID=UPI0037A4712C